MTDAPAKAWRIVLDRIENDLMSGELGPGDRLPPERELATTLGVGRSSVREALRVLEVMGLIRTGTGSGPTAGAIIIGTPSGGMSALLRLQLAAQSFAVEDVVQTRIALESAVVADLATAVSPDLVDVQRVLGAMDDTSLSPEEFVALDAQLHLALAEAAGNGVTVAMMGGLRDAIEGYVARGIRRIADWDDAAVRLRHEHHRIVELIGDGQADAARAAVTDHIRGYYATVTAPTE
ncbi:FadR/GntR family transcriptional regulator [Microbacterium schleiferi]|uniref:FadR/GntR family transcriptional regulator n=1 Tax=Microbacterium schleiferi TaxID=69362 RepID=UPI00311E7302